MSKCIECGGELECGKFAYRQEMCWDCFEEHIQKVILLTKVLWGEDNPYIDYITYLLNSHKVLYGVPNNGRIKLG